MPGEISEERTTTDQAEEINDQSEEMQEKGSVQCADTTQTNPYTMDSTVTSDRNTAVPSNMTRKPTRYSQRSHAPDDCYQPTFYLAKEGCYVLIYALQFIIHWWAWARPRFLLIIFK